MIKPERLKRGDEIRVIAPSTSLAKMKPDVCERSLQYLRAQGFHVTFSENCRELDEFGSSSVASRVEDLHAAFADPKVKMIVSCTGGFNVNQILPHLDYELIRKNPKILCGDSDITALRHAIYAKTGLVTYHGPHFSTWGHENVNGYTRNAFWDCVMKDNPIVVTASADARKYEVIQEGCCEGAAVGGNLCTLNLLQGTEFWPDMKDKILFLEDDNIMGEYFVREFDRNLQSLLQVHGADRIRGIVFGRFDESCGMNAKLMKNIIKNKVRPDIPVVFGVDFGHVLPMITFPIGGTVRLDAQNEHVKLEIINH